MRNSSVEPLGVWDICAAVFAVLFLALETVSDEYQWKFHHIFVKILVKFESEIV